jgi:hypothetical protein
MPVKMAGLSTVLGPVNTTGYLFGEEQDQYQPTRIQTQATSPEAKAYLQLDANDDKFPILVRRDGENMQLPAPSAAMAQQIGSDNQLLTDHSTTTRHNRQAPSLNTMRHTGYGEPPLSPLHGLMTELNTVKKAAASRRSLEVKFGALAAPKRPGLLASSKTIGSNGLPKMQGSYSTNDIPTLKKTNAGNSIDTSGAVQSPRPEFASPARQTATLNGGQQNDFHTPSHQTAGALVRSAEHNGTSSAQRSALQASAAPFGPSVTSPSTQLAHAINTNGNGNGNGHISPPPMQNYANGAFYGGYGMQMMNNGFNGMHLGNQNQVGQWTGHSQMSPGYQNGHVGGHAQQQQFTQQSPVRYNDSQNRVMQQRRNQNGDGICPLPSSSLQVSLTRRQTTPASPTSSCRILPVRSTVSARINTAAAFCRRRLKRVTKRTSDLSLRKPTRT